MAATAAAYAPALGVPLVFDDQLLVERGELHATSLSPAELLRAAPAFPLGRWLTYVTLAANHALHGLRPMGYHLANVLIHVAVALLFWRLSRILLARLAPGDPRRRDVAAAVAALLFALHPVQTMAVTYVIQRAASLGALFALGAIWAWLRGRDAPRGGRAPWIVAAGALWFLSFSSKENFAVLPGIVLLLEWLAGTDLAALARRRPRLSVALAAFLAAAAAALLATYLPVIREQSPQYGLPLGQRLLTQPRVLWHYLSLLVVPLPSRLHVDYYWPQSQGLFSPPTTAAAAAGLLGLAAMAVRVRKTHPLVTLAVGWFLVALVVEQTVLPIDFVFEQRLYFSALGIFLAAGWAISGLDRVLPTAAPFPAPALAALLAVFLAAGTHLRNRQWQDPATLLADAGATGPGRGRSLLNAATHLRKSGDLDGAERLLLQALALEPGEPRALANLGHIAQRRGQLDVAEQRYRAAAAASPRDAGIRYNLGTVLEQSGRPAEAREAYEAALSIQPGLTDARVNLALLHARGGRAGEALATLDQAIALDAGSALARMNRALLRADAGLLDGALADARHAVRLAAEDANSHFVHGSVLARAGRLAEARSALGEALRLAPGHAEAAALLSSLPAR